MNDSPKYEYPESIQQACEILDKVKPGWANKIDLDKFDITDCYDCVLGQLYGVYDNGMLNIFYNIPNRKDFNGNLQVVGLHLHDDVFGHKASSNTWLKEIQKRRIPNE